MSAQILDLLDQCVIDAQICGTQARYAPNVLTSGIRVKTVQNVPMNALQGLSAMSALTLDLLDLIVMNVLLSTKVRIVGYLRHA